MIKIVAAFLRPLAGKTGRLVSETISSLSISVPMDQGTLQHGGVRTTMVPDPAPAKASPETTAYSGQDNIAGEPIAKPQDGVLCEFEPPRCSRGGRHAFRQSVSGSAWQSTWFGTLRYARDLKSNLIDSALLQH